MSINALTEHESFLREFIALYRQLPVLWDQKHPQYRNRAERSEAYEGLLEITKQYYPNADSDFVRSKIDSMRSVFRKERKKVLKSKENAEDAKDIYKPQLWYYDLLLFTAGEEEEEIDEKPTVKDTNKIIHWSREHIAILIEHFKNHPCLYNSSDQRYRNRARKDEAIAEITQKLIDATGKLFQDRDVRKKINLLKAQYSDEMRKVKNGEGSSFWCLDILNFLENKGPSKSLKRKVRTDSDSDFEVDDENSIKVETGADAQPDPLDLDGGDSDNDDIYDTIAQNVAHKLRTMDAGQRKLAEHLVQEVLYYGQMEQLTEDSRLSVNGK